MFLWIDSLCLNEKRKEEEVQSLKVEMSKLGLKPNMIRFTETAELVKEVANYDDKTTISIISSPKKVH